MPPLERPDFASIRPVEIRPRGVEAQKPEIKGPTEEEIYTPKQLEFAKNLLKAFPDPKNLGQEVRDNIDSNIQNTPKALEDLPAEIQEQISEINPDTRQIVFKNGDQMSVPPQLVVHSDGKLSLNPLTDKSPVIAAAGQLGAAQSAGTVIPAATTHPQFVVPGKAGSTVQAAPPPPKPAPEPAAPAVQAQTAPMSSAAGEHAGGPGAGAGAQVAAELDKGAANSTSPTGTNLGQVNSGAAAEAARIRNQVQQTDAENSKTIAELSTIGHVVSASAGERQGQEEGKQQSEKGIARKEVAENLADTTKIKNTAGAGTPGQQQK